MKQHFDYQIKFGYDKLFYIVIESLTQISMVCVDVNDINTLDEKYDYCHQFGIHPVFSKKELKND